jgi:hypothetical protein
MQQSSAMRYSQAGSDQLKFVQYDIQQEAKYLDPIRTLISKDLSEPYSIYVYRYFLYQWARFCFMVRTRFLPASFNFIFLVMTHFIYLPAGYMC